MKKDVFESAAHAAMDRTLPPELFSGLLAIAMDAVIAMDHEQHVIFFNEGAERIFGWSASDVVGKPLAMLLPDRFRAAHTGHVQGFAAAHGRARLMGERQKISGLRKSGEEFPAEAAIQRVVVQEREVYAAVLRDVSARERASEALHQAIKARDDVLGIVSHDLRNPANAVKMLARSILEADREEELPEDVVGSVRVIHQAAEQMDALIQDLLDITRLEAGRLVVSLKAVNAPWLVSRAVESMRPLATNRGVTLAAEVAPGLPTLHVDPDRMLQLMSNVLGNAIKFTASGGMVTLDVHASDQGVQFTVTDTGQGIPAALLPRLFERFFQADPTGRLGPRHGAGLGLPIARGIVEAHGGRIWIESKEGKGTTVHFRLPRDRETER
jgi:PAS domain S-box-containing protein